MDRDKLNDLIRILESSELAELEIEEDGCRVRLSKSPAPIHVISATPLDQVPVGQQSEHPDDTGLVTINSPMVGTFYSAPGPGEAPFVLPGDTVEPEQPLCVVEAMKILNTVVAKFPAIVERVLAENSEPVEFGQPLFAVRPLV